jgi:hypothetical protein
MDSDRVGLLVTRYRSLAGMLAVLTAVSWVVVAAMLDGPRSLDTALGAWLAIACTSTVFCGATAVLAGFWTVVGRPEPRDESDQWT